MEPLLYYFARALVACLQRMPLIWVARLGRAAGGFAYWVDFRHRRVALSNLALCFGRERSRSEIRGIARENFRRLGENYACAIKTAGMSLEELSGRVEFVCGPETLSPGPDGEPRGAVAAIGHFGNFELYARFAQFRPSLKCATTYRGLPQPSLNRLVQLLRERSGCLFFERRFEAAALKTFMNQRGIILGLLCDQHAGSNGLRLSFLGHECSTSAAPALFALRYDCSLHVGICYRVGLARWRAELGKEIPTRENGHARPSRAIMQDINDQFERAIRHDPANWFWVHNRWKPFLARRNSVPIQQKPQEGTAGNA
jgi:KDO2-lipid IV(A) lauroyltransferase